MIDILFIDIETDRSGKIRDYGALYRDKELHERNPGRLAEWIKVANTICGHNIIKHDIPELKKILGNEIFKGKKYIDTLLWSPLIFSENPYHHLVKGYKIVNDSEVNNPLSDCKLTKDLLLEELVAFRKLDKDYRKILSALLSDKNEFNSFLERASELSISSATSEMVYPFVEGKLCHKVNLDRFIHQHPIELAYALSIIRLDNNESILPFWVRKQFPETDQVMNALRFSSCSDQTCEYCTTKLNPKKALKTYFGYPDFRKFDESRKISLQEETVQAGLQEHSFVAVFPTGGGKSLTFQLPALIRGDCTRHLTVVISPLQSLMKDQVDNLQDRFQITKAVAINGLLSPLERQEAFERVEKGSAHILYLSPESLRSPSILRLISSRSIARFVIDEAHCFSSWGQDFRVDYLYIAEFIKKIQERNFNKPIPISCFTATAKPQVISDIKSYFRSRLELELEGFITQKRRKNLSFEVLKTETPEGKKHQLFDLVQKSEKPIIIYASRTKAVEGVATDLAKSGFKTTFFHGQLDKDVKKKNMEDFMSGKSPIIVATSAFGMGVDKEDVRTVIHYNISDSLENYIQEAGRAGRNEHIKAKCFILYNDSDLNKHFSLLQQTKLNKKEIDEIWKSLKSQAKRRSKISHSALEIAKSAGWDIELKDLETKVKTAISCLEDRGFLKREQNSSMVYADSLLVKNFMRGQSLIQQSDLLTEKDKQDCERVLQRIIKDEETRLEYLSDSTQLTIEKVQESIRTLRDLNILGDAKDLTAFLNLNNSKNGSATITKHFLEIERFLYQWLDKKDRIKISLRQLNQIVIDSGKVDSTVDSIHRILAYWEVRRCITKKRIDREKEIYEIVVKSKVDLDNDVEWRHKLSGSIIKILTDFAITQNNPIKQKDQVPVGFSLIELRDNNLFMGKVVEGGTSKYEKTLLFLNQINAIKLEGGFMVSYNRLNIEDIKGKEKPNFKVEDYAKMEMHYQHKTEQIHIVGEYAKKCVDNYESALSYVNDYFTLEYEEFLARYFPRRKSEIRRPLTPDKFKEVIKDLDTDQTQVLNDNKSDHILVLAGPGSGKTKVLVHKIASLLLLEDIKPEQFLMLTFSKSAAMEFRQRIRKLVPEFTGLIKITTFHGFCFELMGQLGDLVKSQNIISECLEGIKNEDVDTTIISNKSVLLLDEFQDINQQEWNLIKKIIEIAGNIRVIAVGDDDQNIYEFRGASNRFMKEYQKTYQSVQYSLIKNYRSREGIIKFNNQLLSTIPNRLKLEKLIPAKKTKQARISITKYLTKNLVQPLVNSISSAETNGTQAVLVHTNREALMLSSLLEMRGYKTRLLAGFDGFNLNQLDEIRSFTNVLKNNVDDTGLIYEENWKNSLEWFKKKYTGTLHFTTCLSVLHQFEKAYPEKKILVEWYEYSREIKMEDAIRIDSSLIVVSTMHKAKGKEFDHVWLLLEDFNFSTDAAKRQIYVACSRAKESLHIHTNTSFFDNIKVDEQKVFHYSQPTAPPAFYDLVLSHKDVNLGDQKYHSNSISINTLNTGDSLKIDSVNFGENQAFGFRCDKSKNVMLFSKAFVNKELKELEKSGYYLRKARVEYLVHWYDKDEEKEYKIVLPRLRFLKRK